MGERDPDQIFDDQENSVIDTTKHDEKNNINELDEKKSIIGEPQFVERNSSIGMKEIDGSNIDMTRFFKEAKEVNIDLARLTTESSVGIQGRESITAQKAGILGQKDSAEMDRIKKNLDKIKMLYTTDRSKKESLLALTLKIEDTYLDAINSCQYYLKHKSTFFGSARYRAVIETLNKLNNELGSISAFKLRQARMTDDEKAMFKNATDIMYFSKVMEFEQSSGAYKPEAVEADKFYNGRKMTDNDNKPSDPEDVLNSLTKLEETPRCIASLIMGVHSPTELMSRLGKDGADISRALLRLLKQFKPHTAQVKYFNTARFGYHGDTFLRKFEGSSKKIQHTTMGLVQEEDGKLSLRIIEKNGSKLIQLPFTSEALFNKLQDDMMLHEDKFGKKFTNNALAWIKNEKLDLVQQSKLRDTCTTLIERRFGLSHEKYGAVLRAVPVDRLRETAIKLIDSVNYTKDEFLSDNHIIVYRNSPIIGTVINDEKAKNQAIKNIEKENKEEKKARESEENKENKDNENNEAAEIAALFEKVKGIFGAKDEEDIKEEDEKEDNIEDIKDNANEEEINTDAKPAMIEREIDQSLEEERIAKEKNNKILEEQDNKILKDVQNFETYSVDRLADSEMNTDEILEKIKNSKKDDIKNKIIHSEKDAKKKNETFVVEDEEELLSEKDRQDLLDKKKALEELEEERIKEAEEAERVYKEKTEWNEQEEKIKNLIADLIFSADSVQVDIDNKKFKADKEKEDKIIIEKEEEDEKEEAAEKVEVDEEVAEARKKKEAELKDPRFIRMSNIIKNNADIIISIIKDRNILFRFLNRVSIPIYDNKKELFDIINNSLDEFSNNDFAKYLTNKYVLSGATTLVSDKLIKLDQALDSICEVMVNQMQKILTNAQDDTIKAQEENKKNEAERKKQTHEDIKLREIRRDVKRDVEAEFAARQAREAKEAKGNKAANKAANKAKQPEAKIEKDPNLLDEFYIQERMNAIIIEHGQEAGAAYADKLLLYNGFITKQEADKIEADFVAAGFKTPRIKAVFTDKLFTELSKVLSNKGGDDPARVLLFGKYATLEYDTEVEFEDELTEYVEAVLVKQKYKKKTGKELLAEQKEKEIEKRTKERYDRFLKEQEELYKEEQINGLNGLNDIIRDIKISKSSAPANESEQQKFAREAPILRAIVEDSLSGNSGQGLFMKNVMNEYFAGVSLMDKRSMLGAAIRNLKPIPKNEADEIREQYDNALYEAEKMQYEKKLEKYEKKLKEYKEKKAKKGGGLFGGFFNMFNDAPDDNDDDKEPAKPEEPTFKVSARTEDFDEKYKKEQMGLLLGGVFKGAGPLLQKVLQGMPITSGMDPNMQKALEDVKSNLLPIPRDVVDAQLLDMINKSDGKITKIDVVSSLGAASVGQAFLCKMFGPGLGTEGREVVVKILRPDVQHRMERDKDVLLRCAEKTNAGMRATYEGQLKRIEEELNLVIEARNVNLGKVYDKSYNKDKSYDNVESMKLCDLVEATEDYMVAEKAEGATVDRYLKDIDKKVKDYLKPFMKKKENSDEYVYVDGKPFLEINETNSRKHYNTVEVINEMISEALKCQAHLAKLAEKWVTEGLYGEGFYHGDLHAGNIMISPNKATVIDFGNSTKLSDDEKNYVTRMMVAAGTADVDLFIDCYKNLMTGGTAMKQKFEEQKDKFKKILTPMFSLGDIRLTGEKIAAALLKAQEFGLELPASIQNFSTCQIRLSNTIASMNDKIEELRALSTQLSTQLEGNNEDSVNFVRETKNHMLAAARFDHYWDETIFGAEDQLSCDKASMMLDLFVDKDKKDEKGKIDNHNINEEFKKEMDVLENKEERREYFKKMLSTSQFTEKGNDIISEYLTKLNELSSLSKEKKEDALVDNKVFILAHRVKNVLTEFTRRMEGDTRLQVEEADRAEIDNLINQIKKFDDKFFDTVPKRNNPGVTESKENMPKEILSKISKYYVKYLGNTSVEEDITKYWEKLDRLRANEAELSEDEKQELDNEKSQIWNKYYNKFIIINDKHNRETVNKLRVTNAENKLDNFDRLMFEMDIDRFNSSMRSYYSDKYYGEELRSNAKEYYEIVSQLKSINNDENLSVEQKDAKRKEIHVQKNDLTEKIRVLIDRISLNRTGDLRPFVQQISDSMEKTFGYTENFMDIMSRVTSKYKYSSFKRMGTWWTVTHLYDMYVAKQ